MTLGWLKKMPRAAEKNLDISQRAQKLILDPCVDMLSNGCYDIAKLWFPEILEDHGWLCSERVELAVWKNVFRSREARLARSHFDYAGMRELGGYGLTPGELWWRNVQARNLDAHRHEITISQFLEVARNGRILMRLFRDRTREAFFSDLENKLILVEFWAKKDYENSRADLIKDLTNQRNRRLRAKATDAMKRGRQRRRLGIAHLLEDIYEGYRSQIRVEKRMEEMRLWA